MSTICLAAQRSFNTGEAVYFSYRFPDMRKALFRSMLWLLTFATFAIAGLYTHIYWHCQHPAPKLKPVKVVDPEVHLSEMHYVYVSKPFPVARPAPVPVPQPLPPMHDDVPVQQDSDWQQAPDGDLSEQSLPGAEEQTPSLKERFMQALQEQKEEYQQGKEPEPPATETPDEQHADQNDGLPSQVATHIQRQPSANN